METTVVEFKTQVDIFSKYYQSHLPIFLVHAISYALFFIDIEYLSDNIIIICDFRSIDFFSL